MTTCCISLENDVCRIVHGSYRRGTLRVSRAQSVAAAEFHDFLRCDRSSSYVVAGDFKLLYQESLLLPNVQQKLIPRLVASEMERLRHPEEEVCFFHQVLGEVHQDGRHYRKVAVFAFAAPQLEETVESFRQCGKKIARLYSTSFALARFLSYAGVSSAEPVLGVADLGSNKCTFLVHNDSLVFMRDIASSGRGMDVRDVQSINMTSDHCFQSLRLRPSRALFVNCAPSAEEPLLPLLLPSEILQPPTCRGIDAQQVGEFAVALGALASGDSEEGGILPESYAAFFARQRFLSGAIAAAVAVGVVGVALGGWQLGRLREADREISSVRQELAAAPADVARYRAQSDGVARFLPVIKVINEAQGAPDLRKLALAIQGMAAQRVELEEVSLATDKDGATLSVHGRLQGASLQECYLALERVRSVITAVRDAAITTQHFDTNERSFTIDARIKG